MGARDLPKGVIPCLTFVGFRGGVRGRADALVRSSLCVGLAFIGCDAEVMGERSEFGTQLLLDDRFAVIEFLQVGLMGGGCGTLEGFDIHGLKVAVIEGAAISDGLSFRSLAGIMVEVLVVAHEASLEIVHVFGHPGDDVTVLGLVKEDAMGVFAKVVGLDEEPIHDVGVSAVNIQDPVIVRYEEANKHFLYGFKLAGDPAVGLFREGGYGGSRDGTLGSAGVLITSLQDGLPVRLGEVDVTLFEAT